MKRVGLIIWYFFVGIIVSPFVPFATAYMAAKGDFDQR